jgi:hypothetical protein
MKAIRRAIAVWVIGVLIIIDLPGFAYTFFRIGYVAIFRHKFMVDAARRLAFEESITIDDAQKRMSSALWMQSRKRGHLFSFIFWVMIIIKWIVITFPEFFVVA